MATPVAVRRPDRILGRHANPTWPRLGPAQRWRPRPGEPRAAVLIHHGLADHSDRQAGFAEPPGPRHAVWAFDRRGHGRSAGVRVQIGRVDDLLDDHAAFVARVRDRRARARDRALRPQPGWADVRYGSTVRARAGPLVALGYRNLGGVDFRAPPSALSYGGGT